MIVFYLCVGALLCVALVLLGWRHVHSERPADVENPNIGWYRQRLGEIGDDPGLIDEARLRLLDDQVSIDNGENPTSLKDDYKAPNLWLLPLLAVLLVVISSGLYWKIGAAEDVLIFRQLSTINESSSEADKQALFDRIEARSEARAGNLQYLSLLGRLHMAEQDYVAASRAFEQLASQAPENPEALALAAQASFLAGGRNLDESSQLRAEQALALDPNQRTALGLLGMVSFERDEFSAAIDYWQRLQALEAVGSPAYDMLADVIGLARERSGIVSEASPAPPSLVEVSLNVEAGQTLDPDLVTFVFVRSGSAQGGMPIAVRRLRVGDLPARIQLGDGDSMAGQLLSETASVRIFAQVSSDGTPGAESALLSAVSEVIELPQSGSVALVLRGPSDAAPGAL